MARGAAIVGVGETPYVRQPPDALTTHEVVGRAARLALDDAGLRPRDVDGLGISSFSLAPDRAIDLALRLGLRVRWLQDSGLGGASGIDLVQHAVAAVEAGDCAVALLVAGDVVRDFRALVDGFNVATRDRLAPIPHGGPNALFAMVTRRHMSLHGLRREDYGRLVVAQRAWAVENPNAAYRTPLTLAEYLRAPIVSDPLCVFDCAPIVAGAAALVVRADSAGVHVRAVRALHNADLHEGDGLATGLSELGLWQAAAAGPWEMDVISVYDDYPAMSLIQLADLGFGEPRAVVDAVERRRLRVNTGGGQLSAGQAGAAGGMLGVVEVARRLRAGEGRLGVVTGYGMVAYRYGACANAAVLERS